MSTSNDRTLNAFEKRITTRSHITASVERWGPAVAKSARGLCNLV